MKNHWVSMKEHMGTWIVEFPPIAGKQDFGKLLDYTAEFLAIGEEENVFRVKQSSMGRIGAPKIPYLEQLRWSVEETGLLPFFEYIGGFFIDEKGLYIDTPIKDENDFFAHTPSKIAYYNLEDKIEEDEISNLRVLLKTLCPNIWKASDEDWAARPFAPLFIHGGSNYLAMSRGNAKPEVWISLHTDIWFPKLIGYQIEQELRASLIDNRELANIHTPRLNRFLAAIQKLSLKYEAEWHVFRPEYYRDYWEMMVEAGINLDT